MNFDIRTSNTENNEIQNAEGTAETNQEKIEMTLAELFEMGFH